MAAAPGRRRRSDSTSQRGSTPRLDALPAGRDVDEVRADVLATAGQAHVDIRDLSAARSDFDRLRRLGETLDDRRVGDVRGVESGPHRRISRATSSPHSSASASWPRAAERAGQEGTAVSAYRDAATLAAIAMDYGAASRNIDAGVRYADSIEQSYCAHVMAATSAIVSWAGADWTDATTRARQAMADHGSASGARDRSLALASVELGRGELASAETDFDHRAPVRPRQRVDRVRPAAAVGPRRGRAPGR